MRELSTKAAIILIFVLFIMGVGVSALLYDLRYSIPELFIPWQMKLAFAGAVFLLSLFFYSNHRFEPLLWFKGLIVILIFWVLLALGNGLVFYFFLNKSELFLLESFRNALFDYTPTFIFQVILSPLLAFPILIQSLGQEEEEKILGEVEEAQQSQEAPGIETESTDEFSLTDEISEASYEVKTEKQDIWSSEPSIEEIGLFDKFLEEVEQEASEEEPEIDISELAPLDIGIAEKIETGGATEKDTTETTEPLEQISEQDDIEPEAARELETEVQEPEIEDIKEDIIPELEELKEDIIGEKDRGGEEEAEPEFEEFKEIEELIAESGPEEVEEPIEPTEKKEEKSTAAKTEPSPSQEEPVPEEIPEREITPEVITRELEELEAMREEESVQPESESVTKSAPEPEPEPEEPPREIDIEGFGGFVEETSDKEQEQQPLKQPKEEEMETLSDFDEDLVEDDEDLPEDLDPDLGELLENLGVEIEEGEEEPAIPEPQAREEQEPKEKSAPQFKPKEKPKEEEPEKRKVDEEGLAEILSELDGLGTPEQAAARRKKSEGEFTEDELRRAMEKSHEGEKEKKAGEPSKESELASDPSDKIEISVRKIIQYNASSEGGAVLDKLIRRGSDHKLKIPLRMIIDQLPSRRVEVTVDYIYNMVPIELVNFIAAQQGSDIMELKVQLPMEDIEPQVDPSLLKPGGSDKSESSWIDSGEEDLPSFGD